MSKPVKSFKLGPIEAAIFANEGDQGSFHTVTVQRRYKDADGDWKSSNSFTRLHLPYVIAVTQQALQFLLEQTDREDGT